MKLKNIIRYVLEKKNINKVVCRFWSVFSTNKLSAQRWAPNFRQHDRSHITDMHNLDVNEAKVDGVYNVK